MAVKPTVKRITYAAETNIRLADDLMRNICVCKHTHIHISVITLTNEERKTSE